MARVGPQRHRKKTYVQSNIEARSCNHFFRGNTSITYSECVVLALVTQCAKRMRHTGYFGLAGYTIFFSHCLINGTILGVRLVDTSCGFDFIHFCVKHFSF